MDLLSNWKGYFNIFRKNETNSKSSENLTNIALTIESNTTEEQKKTSELQNEAALQQQTEDSTKCITEYNEVFETPRFDLFDIILGNFDNNVKAYDRNTETTECLTEVNGITQEVNRDTPNDNDVSLVHFEHETDDLINNINEEDNLKQEYLELEASRIELQDYIPTIDLCSDSTFESNQLGNINEFRETNEPNDFDKIQTSEKINARFEEADIISISSENSEELDEDLNNKESQDNNEPTIVTDEVKEINDVVIKEVVSDDDCGYQSSDFEFITEEEAKLDGLIINIDPNKPKEKVDKRKRLKRVKTNKIGIDPFSGQRYIKSPNRKRIPRKNPKWNNLGPGPINKPGTCPEMDNSRSGPNIMPGNSPDLNHVSPGNSNTQYGFGSSLRNFRKICPKNNIGPGSSKLKIPDEDSVTADQSAHAQNNNLVPGPKEKDGSLVKFVEDRHDFGPTILINCTERSNSLQINYPRTNMQENGPGSSNTRDYPDTSEKERWRTFQHRNQNMEQLVPDHSYEENHRMFVGEQFYRLFDPNLGPLPNHSSIRFLENKSTMSGTMLVEYQGIGFNMRMLREMDENEACEVKEDADECARKIFEMYPGENRKRRRRF